MSFKSKVWVVFVALLLVTVAANLPVLAAEQIRVVNNLENYSSRISITESSASAVGFNIDMEAMALNPAGVPEGSYSTIQLPEGNTLVAGQMTDVGMPQMPTISTFVGIPDFAGVTLTANYESFEIIDNVDILPAQEPEPEGGVAVAIPFAKDMPTYSQDRFFPEMLAEAGSPVIMHDARMAQVTVYPVQYNPVKHQLKIYRNVSVNLAFEGEVINPLTDRRPYLSEAFMPLYRSLIANFDEYVISLSISEVKRGGIIYIVPNIGSFMWKAPMKQLVDWKRAKGYDVQLVTTTDIIPTGRPTPAQIKTYLTTAYATWPIRPDYVCLVGDEDISSGGILMPDYPYNYEGSTYASDHQYSCLAGSDWLPDVAVARISVDNISELNTFISKNIKYEKTPDITVDPGYWRRGISVATYAQAISPVWTCLWVRERLLMHGFTRVDTVNYTSSYDPPDNLITGPITAGVGFVNYRGWAGASGWMQPSYYVGELGQCANINKPGVMTSIVCGTGDFGPGGSDPCFGEKWIRMGTAASPTGGPAFMGSTDHGTHTQWNNPITIGFYDSFLEKGIYNFGMAAIGGKMRQYVSYPRALTTIQLYFHTYNMLGDPELEMRETTPQQITATHPTDVALGMNHVQVSVVNSYSHPVEGAYVTLIMADSATEHFFGVAKTDVDGIAIVQVPTDTTGTLRLTVTGRDLNPYMSTVNVIQSDEAVVYNAVVIDDDNSGYSHGDGNSLASPSETVELGIQLKNTGAAITAQNVEAVLSVLDNNKAVVNVNRIPYGNIAPGQTADGDDKFVVSINSDAVDGEEISFKLEVISTEHPDGWVTYFAIPITAPKFRVTSVVVSGNGRLDPNETDTLIVNVNNFGRLGATGVTGVLSTNDGYTHVLSATGSFGDIPINDTANNATSQFYVAVDASVFKGKNVPFTLNLTSANGIISRVGFNLTVGTIAITDPAGPDGYGYYVFDNIDTTYSEHPTYEWTEIRTIGTNLNLGDDASRTVHIPFAFTYYGIRYDRITVCSNGWFSMDSTHWTDFRNWPFPDPSNCPAMIAPFWDDLVPSGANNIYVYADTTNHKYMIEWYQLNGNTYTATQTFQAILYDPTYYPTITGDGIIDFVYKRIKNGETDTEENAATIGWESPDETMGFNITYSTQWAPGCRTISASVNDSLRVYRITTNTGRGSVTGRVLADVGDGNDAKIEISTDQWGIVGNTGTYSVPGIPPGMVNVRVSKSGYFPQVLTDVSIAANAVTSNPNVTLLVCPKPDGFTASDNLDSVIQLGWNAVSHSDLAGYDIYRSHWQNGVFTKINSSPVTATSYTDYGVTDSTLYWYYVVAVYEGADYQAQSLSSAYDSGRRLTSVTDIAESSALPKEFAVAQNYPNPFNAKTVINYSLPSSGRVTLDVFNVLGQKVVTLINGYQEAGYRSIIWDGSGDNGRTTSSGVYFYRLSMSDKVITKRMLMLK